MPGVLHTVLVSPVQKRHRYTGYSQTKEHQDDEGTGALLLTENAQRDRTVQPREDASQLLYSSAQ